MRKATLADITDGFLRAANAVNAPSSVQAKAIDLRRHILPVLGAVRLEELDGVAVAMFASRKLSEGMRPKTINNILSTLRRVLCYAVDRGYAASVPLFPWQSAPDKTRDKLTSDERDRLSQSSEGAWRVAVELAFTGLNRSGRRLAKLAGVHGGPRARRNGSSGARIEARRDSWIALVGSGSRPRNPPSQANARAGPSEQTGRRAASNDSSEPAGPARSSGTRPRSRGARVVHGAGDRVDGGPGQPSTLGGMHASRTPATGLGGAAPGPFATAERRSKDEIQPHSYP